MTVNHYKNTNNQRIISNTFYLYIRSILIIFISLASSRIVLKNLGVTDFGLYNVVGGVVLMFSFLNNALTAAVQRFISFELGRNNLEQLKKVFSLSVTVHFLLALLIIVVAETIGYWFFSHYLNIPEERYNAALVVYNTAIFAFFFSVIQVPYTACIVAHENMKYYAFVQVSDILLKLLAVIALGFLNGDRLIYYGFFLLFVSICTFLFYSVYSLTKFDECKFSFLWDKKLFKDIMGFSTWSLFGGLASVASSQGVNIILNIFFGAIVNAARGIAFQVNSAVTSLYSSFSQAVNPQIVKQYSAKNYDYVASLAYSSSKMIYFLVLFFALPVMVETEYIIGLWLGQLPQHVVGFCRLVLISTLIDCFSMPFVQVVQAMGKIQKYQLLIGSTLLLDLPLSVIAIKTTGEPESCFYVHILIVMATSYIRARMSSVILERSFRDFLKNVLLRLFLVTIACLVVFIIPVLFEVSFLRFMITCFSCCIITTASVFFIGMNDTEKIMCLSKIKTIISKQ